MRRARSRSRSSKWWLGRSLMVIGSLAPLSNRLLAAESSVRAGDPTRTSRITVLFRGYVRFTCDCDIVPGFWEFGTRRNRPF